MTTSRGKYSDLTELDDLDEPSITASDSSERKLARRIRIQRRLEALTKQAEMQDEEVIQKTPIERQILKSLDILDKLAAEGDEVVSGVKVANDARELQRRREEQEIRRMLLTMLEEEDKECMRRYGEINEKWPELISSNDPLDIHSAMAAQNVKCLDILAKKDAVIADLRQELENADLKFVNDQKNQNEDIDLLIERMENQVKVMANAYRNELVLINNVIESERKILLETTTEKWEVLYKKLQDDSYRGIKERKEIMREYEEEMRKAMIEHQEEYRCQKISLELEIQKLQQEVENTKTLCLINTEKLNYSYAVLKCREEENIIVKNQQKRKINRLQDVLNTLKRNYTKLEQCSRFEIQKLTDQVLKLHKSIIDLEEKTNHFTIINDRKYMQIWDINIKSANEFLDKILTADKIIYEQALGLEWQPPEKQLLKKEDLPSYCSVMCALEKEKSEVKQKGAISTSYKPAVTLKEINLERRLLNHIIKQISDHCDYFIDDSLQELLLSHTENDKLIIRLDNVFQALNINSKEELQLLLNFFLPYAYCPTCAAKDTSNSAVCGRPGEDVASSSSTSLSVYPDICGSNEELNVQETKLVDAAKEICDEKPHADSDVCTPCISGQSMISEVTPENMKNTPCMIIDNDVTKQQLLCSEGHFLEIETTSVSIALKKFVEQYHFIKHDEIPLLLREKLLNSKLTVSRNVTIQDVTEFWKRYSEMFSEEKERVWDALLIGLKKYYEVLKERHQLNAETESLRKQNAELRRLLKTYGTESEAGDITQDEILSICNMTSRIVLS
ncbi:hypothetical protein KM043_015468 [Ampulex compressa]|nr:hypothetical protein KM043_015468 [Ampulex compressa]